MIRIAHLTKQFDTTTAVEGLTLEVAEGEVFGLLGPNGAGKTTTVRMLSTLIAPTAGEAWVAGQQLGASEAGNALIRRSVGLLTEVPGLYERLSAEQNLRIFAGLYGVADGPVQVKRYLQLMGLWNQRRDPVASFSKGMKQKLAIARALLHEPQVLFLDEPTSGLDPESARMVRESIGELRAQGRTVFLCTHNLVEADQLCDRVGIMRQRLLRVDTPEHLRQELWEPQVTLRIRGRAEGYQALLSPLPFVRHITSSGDSMTVTLTSGGEKQEATAAMVRRLVEAGADLFAVAEATHSLEDAYLTLLAESQPAELAPRRQTSPKKPAPRTMAGEAVRKGRKDAF
ncbi:MAG TPA: ABC transporter ATP-binding protein [Ktedonobacterales bacterium]|jgi:ABC-2 type transport system ATP-binding protein